jgi:hypothetical protein
MRHPDETLLHIENPSIGAFYSQTRAGSGLQYKFVTKGPKTEQNKHLKCHVFQQDHKLVDLAEVSV